MQKTTRLFFLAGIFIFLNGTFLFAQNGIIKGVVKDAKSHETIVGANVILQGTSIGASTDLDGKFIISNIKPGIYNVVVSYISYKTKIINKVKVAKITTMELNIDIEENATSLQGVVITATRRTGTEVSVISSMRSSSLVINGISSQQISRSQDKDASEVIRRIPGITIMDNRFVVVRGLSQRYNSVLLNNTSTPSSEADMRAFSFDVIPSSLLDNILVYKTPAPGLPADFAGAAINVFTKNDADKNSVSVSYSNSYRSGTTFNDFYSYRIGKYDWLGFDDGSRSLPSGFPDNLNELGSSAEDKAKRTELGRTFNKNWTPTKGTAATDQRFSLGTTSRFLLGNVSVGNITAVNYSYTNNFDKVFRANYQVYDTIGNHSDTSFYFNDKRYTTTAKTGVLHNWSFIFGNNQKIEFRNLFNQIGISKVTLRDGEDFYSGQKIRAYEMRFMSRSTYSGQLGGEHKLNSDRTKIDWNLGYSYANRKEPDVKRMTTVLNDDPQSEYYGQYGINVSFSASPELLGRLFVDMHENIYTANANISHKFIFGDFTPELKAGFYYEKKNREFSTRNIGYAASRYFDWINAPYMSVDSIFLNENINDSTGIHIDEKTNGSDSYKATNELIAAYASFKIPFTARISLYTGARMEQNKQTLDSYASDNPNKKVNVNLDEMHFFPSANLAFNLDEKTILRLAYGMTINRPEFREIAPFYFYDFEQKAGIRGNPDLKNAVIHNIDLRYEYYPTSGEIISLAGFYKKFNDPIEAIQYNAGTGWDYKYENAKSATSIGAEIEIRKSFAKLAQQANMLRFIKDLSVVFNASWIYTEMKFDPEKYYVSDSKRAMQGQSPYIINTGLYYQNDKNKLTASVLYNVIGKRIKLVGMDMPNTYEMPRNSLDFSFTKNLGKNLQLKGGIQDILNEKYTEKQFVHYILDGKSYQKEQVTFSYRPGMYYTLGFVLNL